MFGENPIRKPSKSDGNILEIQSIFKTFQGEGPYVGHPSIFIRLGGCNLACNFCDTEFESFKEMEIENVINITNKLSLNPLSNIKTHNLVVITGGEPLRQSIERLCDRLIEFDYLIQIETNGTLYRNINKNVKIICSPKNLNGYQPIRGDLIKRINAFKFIISASDEKYNFVPEVGQTERDIPVYIQPMDEYNPIKNKENLDFVKELAEKEGYRISLQTHKILDIE